MPLPMRLVPLLASAERQARHLRGQVAAVLAKLRGHHRAEKRQRLSLWASSAKKHTRNEHRMLTWDGTGCF